MSECVSRVHVDLGGRLMQVDAGCILARSTNDSLQVNRTTEPSEIGAADPSGGGEILGKH